MKIHLERAHRKQYKKYVNMVKDETKEEEKEEEVVKDIERVFESELGHLIIVDVEYYPTGPVANASQIM
jgi:hypothetical protein